MKGSVKKTLENLIPRTKEGVRGIENFSAEVDECNVSDPCNNDDLAWCHGRRVVELGVLAEGLAKCSASDCDK